LPERLGVDVREGVTVKDIYLVDASGRFGLLARHLSNRRYHDAFR
jgi:hypothetical protein